MQTMGLLKGSLSMRTSNENKKSDVALLSRDWTAATAGLLTFDMCLISMT